MYSNDQNQRGIQLAIANFDQIEQTEILKNILFTQIPTMTIQPKSIAENRVFCTASLARDVLTPGSCHIAIPLP